MTTMNMFGLAVKDNNRMRAYEKAINANRRLFEGKIILNVHSEMGVLAMFAANAGAKRVIGIEEIVDYAKASVELIKENGLEHDGIEKVDVIISDWTRHCLFRQSPVRCVLYARDKWLKTGGLIFPNRATLRICGVDFHTYKQNRINWWRDVYGFDMTSVRKRALTEPHILHVRSVHVATESSMLKEFDLYTATVDDLSVDSRFALKTFGDCLVDSLATFFTVGFEKPRKAAAKWFPFLRTRNRLFSTAPGQPLTLWGQMVFFLDGDIIAKEGEILEGIFRLQSTPTGELEVVIRSCFRGIFSQLEETNEYLTNAFGIWRSVHRLRG